MTKTQKKFDKAIRQALTNACEAIKDDVTGFAWLTHQVDIQNPTNTVKISCYFIDESALRTVNQNSQLANIETIIQRELKTLNLKAQSITFQTDPKE